MGMDPATIGLMAAMIGSSAVSGITAGDGQELQSFEHFPGIDPRTMMGESKDLLSSLLGDFMDLAAEPVTMRTTVNPLPSFRGGALPMAVSVPGMDPNRLNPALRTTPGVPLRKRTLTPGAPGYGPGGGQHPPTSTDTPPDSMFGTDFSTRRAVNPGGPMGGGTGDPAAAAELLLKLSGGAA